MSQNHVAFYRAAFIGHHPQRHALMMPPGALVKYSDRPGPITDEMIRQLLAGEITIATPFAADGLASTLVLDVDAGGLAAVSRLMQLLERRGVWSFGELHPRPGLADHEQHGYVYAPFADLSAANRIQQLAQEVISQANQPGWKVEARTHGADTRLPLQRHTHINAFGLLLIDGRTLPPDLARGAVLQVLRQCWHPNNVELLPAVQPATPRRPPGSRNSPATGITIQRFNDEHDLATLIDRYDGKRVTSKLYLCPFHPDNQASLQLWSRDGKDYAHCMSKHSNCPLAERGTNDAFTIYCVGEGLTPAEAVKQLNSQRSTGKALQTHSAGSGRPQHGRGAL